MTSRMHKIRYWTQSTDLKWFDLLSSRKVHIGAHRYWSMKECIEDLPFQSRHVASRDDVRQTDERSMEEIIKEMTEDLDAIHLTEDKIHTK